ncbi:MAG: DUF4091 domain-containing protein [Clostridia bacterium]|nr:DUF4091 domain-containing protein [Clostridia bacterium]
MLKVKLTHSLFKLRDTTDFDSIPQIVSVKTVKNRLCGFQLVLLSDEDCTLRCGDELYYSQHCGCKEYRVSVEGRFAVSASPESFTPDDNGSCADILLSENHLDMTANKCAALWYDVDITQNTSSGKLSVNIYESSMFSDEKLIYTLPLQIDVVDITLPDADKFRFYLDLWQHSSNLARKHETPLFSQEHFEVLESYVKSLAYLGQKAVTVVVSEIPWSGQSCADAKEKANLFEYSMVKVRKTVSGRFEYDYSAMQRYIDLCFANGIDREISVYGLVNIWKGNKEKGFTKPAPRYPDNIRIRYFDESDGSYKFMRRSSQIDNYIKNLERYFIKAGLIEKVRVAADEPADIEAYRRSVSRLHSVAPSFVMKAAINHAEFIPEFKEVIADFVPFISCVSAQYDTIKSYLGMQGKRFLWYVCCYPFYPNTFLSNELCEALFIAVLTSFLGFDGFLRWNYTVFPDDPRSSVKYGVFPCGDVNFVYPSRSGKVLLSLRYKAMRRAAELFELLERAKEKATGTELHALYSCVMRTFDIPSYFTPGHVLEKEKMLSADAADYEELENRIYDILRR